MAGDNEGRPPLPTEPQECRRMAEQMTNNPPAATVWALLAIAGELHDINRKLHKGR